MAWDKVADTVSKFGSALGLGAKSSSVQGRGIVSGSGTTNTSGGATGVAATGVSTGVSAETQASASGTSSAETSTGTSETSSGESGNKPSVSNIAIYQDFKLYIEGEGCPFESVSISFGVSNMPAMTIQLVPYKILRNLEERTKVHFYFIDPVDGKERLLFDGEISGVGRTKNPTEQTITYSVTHVSNYLNEILVSFFDISAYAKVFPPLYIDTLGAEVKSDYSKFEESTMEDIFKADSLAKMGSFHEIFVKIFERVFEVSEGDTLSKTLQYFKDKVDEWKLDKRLTTLPAGGGKVDAAFKLEEFIASENLTAFMLDEVKQVDGFHSLFDMANEVFKRILYYPIILPAPYLYESEYLQTVLYKPQAIFVLPPVCNVVWPSMYSVFSYSRNFKATPTRLFVRTGMSRLMYTKKSGADKALSESTAQYFWAPENLRKMLDGTAETEAVSDIFNKYAWSATVGSGMNSVDLKVAVDAHMALLSTVSEQEEKVGVRLAQPANNAFFTNYAEWLIGGDYTGETAAYPYLNNFENAEDRIGMMADYELARQQFETEMVSMVMVFNPYIVPGFPILIMDKPDSGMHAYGYVSGISHIISAAGGCSTTADIGYIHQYDDILRNSDGEAVKKFIVAEDIWEDEDAVYERLLGVKSIKNADFNTIKDEKKKGDPTEIVDALAEEMAGDGFYDYVYNAYTRSARNIVTKEEYDTFLKDVKYNPDTQEKVRQYRSWVEKRVAGSPDLESTAGASSTDTETSSADQASSAKDVSSSGAGTDQSSDASGSETVDSAGGAGKGTETAASAAETTTKEQTPEEMWNDPVYEATTPEEKAIEKKFADRRKNKKTWGW